jgi:pimeloyl-ACP methyl ester carboxylesterase
LTLPEGAGPFPAAILITGSGPQDRDETVFGHKPFAVLADHLTRHGIAVLRHDDRGVGRSTGEFSAATSADFATDTNAAVRFLMTRSEIDPEAIGLIGHSEGGMVAPLAAADNKGVRFVVLLAGPGTDLMQLALSQQRLMGLSQGVSEEELARMQPVMTGIFTAVSRASNSEDAQTRVRALLTPEALATLKTPEPRKEQLVQHLASEWFRYFLQYKPARSLSRVDVPILALNGSLDRQVPADENLAAIRIAVRRNPDVTIRKLEGLNHMFQTATTGAIGEYADIAETMSPATLSTVTEWIASRFKRAGGAR